MTSELYHCTKLDYRCLQHVLGCLNKKAGKIWMSQSWPLTLPMMGSVHPELRLNKLQTLLEAERMEYLQL